MPLGKGCAMRQRIGLVASVIAGLAFVSAPEFAAADPSHCPPGQAMKGKCRLGEGSAKFQKDRDYRRYDRRDYDRRDYDDDYRTRLEIEDALDDAYEEGFRDGRRAEYEIGQRLDRDLYRVLDRDLYYDRYGRRLDDRYYYAEADGERLLVEAATGMIIDILTRR